MQHNYILLFGEEGLEIVGPFKNREDLKAWGDKWQAAHNDDPRWQSIHLEEENIMLQGFADLVQVSVVAP